MLPLLKAVGGLRFMEKRGAMWRPLQKKIIFVFSVGKIPDSSSVLSQFKDVFAGEYYSDAVIWASLRSITAGTDDTPFQPQRLLRPASQAVAFLWRAVGRPETMGEGSIFSDVKSGEYYEEAVRWAAENNVTAGTGK